MIYVKTEFARLKIRTSIISINVYWFCCCLSLSLSLIFRFIIRSSPFTGALKSEKKSNVKLKNNNNNERMNAEFGIYYLYVCILNGSIAICSLIKLRLLFSPRLESLRCINYVFWLCTDLFYFIFCCCEMKKKTMWPWTRRQHIMLQIF